MNVQFKNSEFSFCNMDSTSPKAGQSQELSSPNAKRALDFDFWSDRKSKVPKVVEEDLSTVAIKDVELTKRLDAKVLLRCSAICDFEKVFKLACDDGDKRITVTAFGKCMEKLRVIKVNDTFFLNKFQVRKEDFAYLTGAYEDFEFVLTEFSTIIPVEETVKTFRCNYQTVNQIKSLTDGSVVDIRAVIAKNWGSTTTSNRKVKLDVSLTDKTMETIRLTVWDGMVDQLVGKELQVVAVKRVLVSSFQGTKFLNCKWHTTIDVNPDSPDSTLLFQWFQSEMAT